MKILLVVATEAEIMPLKKHLSLQDTTATQTVVSKQCYQYTYGKQKIDILITGAGILATSFWLGKMLLKEQYKVVINAGIGGSYNYNLKIGEIVHIKQEEIADLGAENDQTFLPLKTMPFFDADAPPYRSGILHHDGNTLLPAVYKLPQVNGITVNRVSGSQKTILQNQQLFNPTVESMEGAAVFYVALMHGVPFYQIRAISNYVTVRDTSTWDIPLAIRNLNDYLMKGGIIENLKSKS